MKKRDVEVNMVDETELKQEEGHGRNKGSLAAADSALPAGGNKQKAEEGPCPGYKRKGFLKRKCKHCGKKKSEHNHDIII